MIERHRLGRVRAALAATFLVVTLTAPVSEGAALSVSQATSLLGLGTEERPSHPTEAANEVLVRFAPTLSAQSRSDVLGQMAAASHSVGSSGYTLVKLDAQYANVQDAVSSLKAMPGVISAQPNYIYHALAMPNDPSVGQQWALQNTGQTILNTSYSTNNPGTPGDDIDASQAWDYITDCSSVTVAVLDTGINYTQRDLAANMWDGGSAYPHHGYDFVDSDNDPMPAGGGEQHGTHVAGIIGAVGNNGIEGSGVCQKASIMSVRVLDTSETGTTSDVIQGINFAVDHGAKIINMSLGGGKNDPALENAIKYAQQKGVLVVVAAGNSGTDNDTTADYPCDYTEDNLICVAALDQSYDLANFSNYGATSVDIAAPGANYLSTWAGPEIDSDYTGWHFGSTSVAGWAVDNQVLPIPVLVDPSALFQPSNPGYANNTDDRVWGNFDLNGYPNLITAAINYFAGWITESGHDFFNSGYDTTGTDPFDHGGTLLQHSSGNYATDPNYEPGGYKYDISDCIGKSGCAFGFQLTSDNDYVVGPGAYAYGVSVQTIQANTTAEHVASGTSMATPVVSGVAAMLFAYAPDADYHQIINAIYQGGRDVANLAGKTVTGKAVDAMGALADISLGITGLNNVNTTTGTATTATFNLAGAGGLTVTASSANQTLLPDASITGQSSCTANGPCTLTLTPATGQTGTSLITVTVNNAYGKQVQGSFTLTVSTPPPPSSGGGGALNPGWLLLMLIVLLPVARRYYRRHGEPPCG